MRSSLRRLRGLALRRSEPKEKREHRPLAKLDELVQAAQDMRGMKTRYDGLLSAAAATANSAFEFSEALHEMGTCLLENTALHDDEDSGRVSLMLGKAQFELQRFVDNYRAHVIQTITTPSECLLKELQIVEDMKQQCDDKRDLYKFMLTTPSQKVRSRNPKGDTFTPQQLQTAREDYEEEANLFVFRLKSLKQGQSRSLFTQAARHHAAQLNFFRKGFKSLELIEPQVKSIAEQQHIDYHFSELEDDDTYYDVDGGSYYDSSSEGELSFDYGLNEPADDALSMRRNSIVFDQDDNTTTQASSSGILQENVTRIQAEHLHRHQKPSLGSQSAPIFADRNFNFSEKIKRMPPPSTRKFHSYVLPTPVDVKSSASTGTPFSSDQLERRLFNPTPMSPEQPPLELPKDRAGGNLGLSASLGMDYRGEHEVHANGGLPSQMWYSSPLEPHKRLKFGEKNPTRSPKGQALLENSNIKNKATSSEALFSHQYPSFSTSEAKKINRHFFSGPIAGKSWSSKQFFTSGFPKVEDPSPPRSTPRISELHELPRPPSSAAQAAAPSTSVGHSAPLVSGGQNQMRMAGKVFPLASQTASPLPAPPSVLRSFSIPYRGQRTPLGTLNKLLEEVDSPPLTPLSLKVFHTESPSSHKSFF